MILLQPLFILALSGLLQSSPLCVGVKGALGQSEGGEGWCGAESWGKTRVEEYPIFSLLGPRERTTALPHVSIPGWWEARNWKSQNQDGLGLKYP